MNTGATRSVTHTAILALAWVVFAVIVVMSFFPPAAVAPGKWNLGHAPAYAALVLCMLHVFAKTRRTPMFVALIGLVASLLGGTIELLQPLVGRNTSIVDFIYNEIGIVVALTMFASYSLARGHTGWRRT